MKKNAAIIVCLCASFTAANHNSMASEATEPAPSLLRKTNYQQRALTTDTNFGSVLFRSDSDEIDQALWPILRSAVAFAARHPDLVIVLEGHTDVRGSRNHNRTLSSNRIQSVAKYFTRNGISKERIRSRAFGEARASANVKDASGHVFDRRVTITLSRPDQSA